jgi:hypothetical protein
VYVAVQWRKKFPIFLILSKETFSIENEKKENIERAKFLFSSVSKKEKEFLLIKVL